jgi:hypothetical protein
MSFKITNTNQSQTAPKVDQTTPAPSSVDRRTRSSSSKTFTQARALHSVENSPKKPSGTKRSADHLGGNENSVEKTAKVREHVLPAVQPQKINTPEKITFADGSTYKGQTLNGKMHGKGALTWKSGSTYVGEFFNGQFHGDGILSLVNGDQYKGQFIHGKREGKGLLTTAKGDEIKGSFINDKLNGYAVHIFANGDRYEGQFVNNRKEGECTLRYANGDVYVGSYGSDKYQGYGVLNYPNGSEYRGSFLNGKKHGHGTLIFPQNTQDNKLNYSGQFKEDQRNGQGTLNFKNGDYYVGEFMDNKFHGHGSYSTEQSLYNGFFYKGRKYGYAIEIDLLTGEAYNGYYKLGQRSEKPVKSVLFLRDSLEDLALAADSRSL